MDIFEEAINLNPSRPDKSTASFYWLWNKNVNFTLDDLMSNWTTSQDGTKGLEGITFLFSAAIFCGFLGMFSVTLNAFVLFTLWFHQRRVLKNVFFVLVFHCSIVDCIRGFCLILWCIPSLNPEHMSLYNRFLMIKVAQITLVVLRSCNLLTIFNLLIFTINEYIVIKYPLHYRTVFRRRMVLFLIMCTWFISLAFALGSVLAKNIDSKKGWMIPTKIEEINFLNLNNGNVAHLPPSDSAFPLHTAFTFATFVLCYGCLITVFFCYGVVLAAIRKYHNCIKNGDLSKHQSSRAAEVNRCGSHRRWQLHLMSRHKYVLVIGTVLFVDVLFLIPYSGIQIVSYIQLYKSGPEHAPTAAIFRWILQIIIGIHAVCQPLCYFRMTEFRRLACTCCYHSHRGGKIPGFTSTLRRSHEKRSMPAPTGSHLPRGLGYTPSTSRRPSRDTNRSVLKKKPKKELSFSDSEIVICNEEMMPLNGRHGVIPNDFILETGV